MSRTDIQSIHKVNNGIIVKLRRMEVKKSIMSKTLDKFIWSDELFALTKDKRPSMIRVRDHMTPFYCRLWFTAQQLKEGHRLHSFKITERGLFAQRTPMDDGRTVLSEQQLLEYVRNN